MSEKLCFLCCHNFHAEVVASIAAEGWNDVVAVAFPSRCGRPSLSWEELRSLLPEDCQQLIVIGRACLTSIGQPPADFPATRTVPLEQCFHLVAGQTMVTDAMMNGGYLITPTWLASWQEELQKMGFPLAQAGEFFQDFAKELVFLDTCQNPNAQLHLAELCKTVNLPVRRIAVGLDYSRAFLCRLVQEWRLERQQLAHQERHRQHASELANTVCAMDMLARLARSQKESEVIATIEELFYMLFAPKVVYYLRLQNNIPLSSSAIPAELRKTMLELTDTYTRTSDEQGFLLRIKYGGETLGLIAVLQLTFPDYLQRYLNMALALIDVCGLAIENARNRQKLVEAEKMASLAILVAGVAHEINTPLGVGLTAASSLQEQTRHLACSFTERSMTQSDLKNYFTNAETSTVLLRNNLERIGHLIDAFRQVAVDGKSLQKRVFRLYDCLNEVILSLGDRLPAERVTVQIQCDPQLEIESFPDDWVSIFANLLGNSLKHGFKNRQRGVITIQINQDSKKLRVDYSDDGRGLTSEDLSRIFDPFFTTDFQQGMGLGMHLVYNLISHRLGGSIQCDSQPDQGVHFHIEIPL